MTYFKRASTSRIKDADSHAGPVSAALPVRALHLCPQDRAPLPADRWQPFAIGQSSPAAKGHTQGFLGQTKIASDGPPVDYNRISSILASMLFNLLLGISDCAMLHWCGSRKAHVDSPQPIPQAASCFPLLPEARLMLCCSPSLPPSPPFQPLLHPSCSHLPTAGLTPAISISISLGPSRASVLAPKGPVNVICTFSVRALPE